MNFKKIDSHITNNLTERILSGGVWAILGKLTTGVLGILINILLIRILSPGDVGAYFLTYSMVTIFSLMAQFGLPQLIVKLASEDLTLNNIGKLKADITGVISVVLVTCFIVSVLIIAFIGDLVAIDLFHNRTIASTISMITLWAVAMTFQQLFVEIYRGLHDIKMASLFSGVITNTILFVFLSYAWYFKETTYYGVVQLAVYAVCGSVLISAYILWSKIEPLDKIKTKVGKHKMVKNAWPLWVTALTVFVLTQSDLWIVGYFLGSDSVALYGSAAKLILTLSLISSISYAVLPPIISEMNIKDEHKKLQNLLRGSAFANSIVVVPIFIILLLYSSEVLEFLFGEYYRDASKVLIFLLIGVLFNIITGIRGYALMLTGFGRIQMNISILGGVLNLIFCIVGAIKWGIHGVAFGAMSAMIVQCTMELIAVKAKLGIWTHLSISEFKGLVNEYKYANR
jgi:O-antigen/teichoic acid export membrane protein